MGHSVVTAPTTARASDGSFTVTFHFDGGDILRMGGAAPGVRFLGGGNSRSVSWKSNGNHSFTMTLDFIFDRVLLESSVKDDESGENTWYNLTWHHMGEVFLDGHEYVRNPIMGGREVLGSDYLPPYSRPYKCNAPSS